MWRSMLAPGMQWIVCRWGPQVPSAWCPQTPLQCPCIYSFFNMRFLFPTAGEDTGRTLTSTLFLPSRLRHFLLTYLLIHHHIRFSYKWEFFLWNIKPSKQQVKNRYLFFKIRQLENGDYFFFPSNHQHPVTWNETQSGKKNKKVRLDVRWKITKRVVPPCIGSLFSLSGFLVQVFRVEAAAVRGSDPLIVPRSAPLLSISTSALLAGPAPLLRAAPPHTKRTRWSIKTTCNIYMKFYQTIRLVCDFSRYILLHFRMYVSKISLFQRQWSSK